MTDSDRLIVVGPVPPPYHGVSVMTVHLLDALSAHGQVAAHLDTADDRNVHNAGRFDLQNVWLALRHAGAFVVLLARHPGAAVYVPISQNRLGLLRDAVFLVSARIARRRRYVHLHGGHFATFYRDADPITRGVARLAVRGAYQAWVLTPGLSAMFEGLVPADRVHVLENVVDDPLAGDQPAQRADGGLRLLFLSNLVPEKGVFELLDALSLLGQRGRGIEVRFVGEGYDSVERRIDEQAAALAGNGVSIERLGKLTGDRKLEQLRWANALALPTYYPLEGQPLVLLEAMAAGLAVVASRHGGIPDTLRDEREALLHDVRDTAALAEAIERLAGDGDLRRRLGRAARQRWQDRYAPERFGGDVQRLLGQRGS